jgi:EAL domain-containing protein (putative c-di-GMP-specific phosphodiesterase class I)/heme oxygenase
MIDSRHALVGRHLDAALKTDRNQFQLALQPIVDAGSGAVASWEVLVRWHHPVLGNVPPGEFIPIAESMGLVDAVGDLVLEASLQVLVEIPCSIDLIGRAASMSVNVSPQQLARPGFAAEIVAKLDARGIEHRRLCLEVTEAAFANVEAVAAIGAARRLGIRVATDSFGIGNSSLSRLRRLPVDIVKLDRSFLPQLDAIINGGRSFLTAVVALAHAAGLKVAVEGVENQVQLNAAVAAGADAIQGYFLAAPMPAPAAVAVASESNEEHAWCDKFAAAAVFATGASLAPESPGVLERLRAMTLDSDTSVEALPTLSRLMAPDLTMADYVQTLRRLHAFHASIEPDLARALRGRSRGEVLVDGARLAAIEADLAFFGAAPLAPRPLQQPPACVASALGALYVIEGSNLDGRIVGLEVAKNLGVEPGSGGSFYCGLTAEDARHRWHLLQEALRQEIDEAGVPWEPVTASALATQDELEFWMRDQPGQ